MLNYLIPSYGRFFFMIISVYIYYNTYRTISLGIIPVLLFPSFYITYTVIKYPENLNWKGNPNIPKEDNFITELNELIKNPYKTLLIFIPIYVIVSLLIYKKTIKKILIKILNYF